MQYRIIFFVICILGTLGFSGCGQTNKSLKGTASTNPNIELEIVEKGVDKVVPSDIAYQLRQQGGDIVFVRVRERAECSASPAAGKIVIDKLGCKAGHIKYMFEGHRAWEGAGYPVEPYSQ